MAKVEREDFRKNQESRSLTDEQIITEKSLPRRSFLATTGAVLVGGAAARRRWSWAEAPSRNRKTPINREPTIRTRRRTHLTKPKRKIQTRARASIPTRLKTPIKPRLSIRIRPKTPIRPKPRTPTRLSHKTLTKRNPQIHIRASKLSLGRGSVRLFF